MREWSYRSRHFAIGRLYGCFIRHNGRTVLWVRRRPDGKGLSLESTLAPFSHRVGATKPLARLGRWRLELLPPSL